MERLRKLAQPIAKATTWRVIGIIDTVILAYFVTGRIEAAASLAGIGTVTHTILYIAHEKAWTHPRLVRLFGQQKGGHEHAAP